MELFVGQYVNAAVGEEEENESERDEKITNARCTRGATIFNLKGRLG